MMYNYNFCTAGGIQNLKKNGTVVSILDALKAGVSVSEARAPRLLGSMLHQKNIFRHHEIIFDSFLLEKGVRDPVVIIMYS